MPTVKALQFEKHLQQEPLAPAYALVGEDRGLVSMCVSLLKHAVETPDMPGSMTTDLEDPPDPPEVFDELHTQPFMGMAGVRLVIVREGADFVSRHGERIEAYLEHPAGSGVLVLCCEKLDGRLKAAKALKSGAVIVNCEKVRWGDAKGWIVAAARREGKALAPEAASALIEAVGPNLTALGEELEKLVLYVGDEPQITERDVDEIVPQSRSNTVFELSDAIARGDVPGALRTAEDLLLHGEGPEGIVGFLAYRMRALWQTRRLLQKGLATREISRSVGMPEWAVEKASRAVRDLPEAWFAREVAMLAEADVELKSTSLPAREHATWLSAFLVRLCQPRRRPLRGRSSGRTPR